MPHCRWYGQVFNFNDCSTHGMTGDGLDTLGCILYMVVSQRSVFCYIVARCAVELRHVQIFIINFMIK